MRALAVLLALAADAAWNLAGPFWGFTLLAFLVLWIALNQAHIATGSKAYRTEQRLNAVMPRIPNPQPSPGSAGNSSYGPGSGSYTVSNGQSTSGNSSYNVGSPPSAADFNALRNSYSNTVATLNGNVGWNTSMCTAFNVLRNDHTDLIACVGTLRTDHSNLLNSHNTLLNTLNNTNIIH